MRGFRCNNFRAVGDRVGHLVGDDEAVPCRAAAIADRNDASDQKPVGISQTAIEADGQTQIARLAQLPGEEENLRQTQR